MKTAAVHQKLYPVYQAFKAYKEPDQINKYVQHYVNHFWFPTNTKTDVSSRWGAQYPYGDLTHKAAFTLESMWQLALASGLESLACYPQGQGRRARKLLLDFFSICSFQKLYQNL